MNGGPEPLAPHVEQTIRSVTELHAEHQREATRTQRLVERTTGLVGRPWLLAAITLFVAAWIALNLIAARTTAHPWDVPPFNALQGIVTLAALYMTVLIAVTQRREDRLAQHRAALTLQLALLSEQKTAKIIEMLERLRRDHPEIENRIDPEALAMARSTDPQQVLSALHDSTDALASP